MLENTVRTLRTPEGKPLAKPHPQSAAPRAGAGELVLHLTARNLRREGDEWVPVKPSLGKTRSGNWGAYAAEDWIVLTRKEWATLLPAGEVKAGDSWELGREAAARVLTHVYPSTENNDVSKNRIDRQQMRATVLSVRDGVVRARIDGSLRMKHPFYHKDDDNFVEATLVGYLEFEPAGKNIRTFQLATRQATYGRMKFGAVVRSVP